MDYRIFAEPRIFLGSFIKKIKFRYFLPYFILVAVLAGIFLYSYYCVFPMYGKLLEERQRVAVLRHTIKVDFEKASILAIINSFRTGLPHTEKKNISNLIFNVGEKYKINPALILAVIRVESSFNNYSLSDRGAVGLMQVQPVTALYIIKKYKAFSEKLHRYKKYVEYLPADYLYNPDLNIKLGVVYFLGLIHKFKNLKLALFAYNAGPTAAVEILNSSGIKLKSLVRNPVFANFYRSYYKKVEKYYSSYNKRIFGGNGKSSYKYPDFSPAG